jgi:hypothetical protein
MSASALMGLYLITCTTAVLIGVVALQRLWGCGANVAYDRRRLWTGRTVFAALLCGIAIMPATPLPAAIILAVLMAWLATEHPGTHARRP